MFLVRKQIGTVQRFIMYNTNWRVRRNYVKTGNDCTYMVCSVNKKSQGRIPNWEMSNSINQTLGYPLNPAFAKLYSPLEHRALYALVEDLFLIILCGTFEQLNLCCTLIKSCGCQKYLITPRSEHPAKVKHNSNIKAFLKKVYRTYCIGHTAGLLLLIINKNVTCESTR